MTSSTQGSNPTGKSGTPHLRLASMVPQRQREIASHGGRAAAAPGPAHHSLPAEARDSGAVLCIESFS